MSFRNKGIGLALLGALLALASCRDLALDPVFYTLSKEQPLGEDRGFPDKASVFKMVKATLTRPLPDPPADYYLAAAANLYIRGTGTNDRWTVVDPPTGLANAMCNTLEVFNNGTADYIYAGFFNSSNGTGYGLYTAPLSLPITWTAVADAAVQNTEITLLKAVGGISGQLFVATNNSSNVNALYYWNGAAFAAVTLTPPPGIDISTFSFIDVDRATFGAGSYWILVGAYLYQNASLPGPFAQYSGGADSPAYPLSPLDTPASGGLLDDGTALYVAGGNGLLYRTADAGANWTRIADTDRIKDDSGAPVHFTAFTALSAASDAGAVYVGTMGQGYYRIPGGDVTGGAGALTREPSYNITSLYAGALYFLFYDATAPIQPSLFLCTTSAGLWRGDFASGSIWTWKQE